MNIKDLGELAKINTEVIKETGRMSDLEYLKDNIKNFDCTELKLKITGCNRNGARQVLGDYGIGDRYLLPILEDEINKCRSKVDKLLKKAQGVVGNDDTLIKTYTWTGHIATSTEGITIETTSSCKVQAESKEKARDIIANYINTYEINLDDIEEVR